LCPIEKNKTTMIQVDHQAYFLFREDAYREYCYSVDAYGQYQPASFIYLCFEEYRDFCIKKNLLLQSFSDKDTSGNLHKWRYERMRASFNNVRARILRVHDKEELNKVWKYLNRGENVIALYPKEQLTLHSTKDKEDFEEIESMFTTLDSSLIEFFSKASLGGDRNHIWWKVIETNTRGKLIITQDSFLSDGYFFKGYGKSEINQVEIDGITEEFRRFKYNLVDVNLQEESLTWICNEPIEYILTLTNHGPLIDDFTFTVNINEDFEPLSTLEFKIKNFPSLGRRSIAIKCIPRVIGKFDNIIEVNSNIAEINLNTKPCIVIKPNSYQKEKDLLLTDDKGLSYLINEYEKFGEVSRVVKIRELMRIDIDSSLNKLRSMAEEMYPPIAPHLVN
jgi:hypothetical protein